MRVIPSTNKRAVAALLDRRPGRDEVIQRRVKAIVDRVRSRGDQALLSYARKFDGLEGSIEISAGEIELAARSVEPNVRTDDLDSVLALLPALQQPTISPLSDSSWVALNTIIEERTVRDLIPKLKAARAQGIVEYPLNKIVL